MAFSFYLFFFVIFLFEARISLPPIQSEIRMTLLSRESYSSLHGCPCLSQFPCFLPCVKVHGLERIHGRREVLRWEEERNNLSDPLNNHPRLPLVFYFPSLYRT